jgi:hypothetical protein
MSLEPGPLCVSLPVGASACRWIGGRSRLHSSPNASSSRWRSLPGGRSRMGRRFPASARGPEVAGRWERRLRCGPTCTWAVSWATKCSPSDSPAGSCAPGWRRLPARELFRSTQIFEGRLSPQTQATKDEALAPERVGPWLILVTDVRGVYSRGRHSRAAAHLDAVGGEPEFLGRVSRCSGCSGRVKPDREPVS